MVSYPEEFPEDSFFRLVDDQPVLVCLDYLYFGKTLRDLKRQYEKNKFLGLVSGALSSISRFAPFVPEAVVEIPPSLGSKTKRGYDLNNFFSEKIAVTYSTKNLKVFHSFSRTQQKELSRVQRKASQSNLVVDKMWIDCLKQINSIWVVDDVVTTGSTMKQAFICLKEVNPDLKLFGIAVCGKRF